MKKSYDEKKHPRDAEGRFESKSSAQGGSKSKNSSQKNSNQNRSRDAEGRFK